MPEEILTAYLVHPSNVVSLNQRFGPMNTFMYADSGYEIKTGTWVVILRLRTEDPFEPTTYREVVWHWNLTEEQMRLRFEIVGRLSGNPHLVTVRRK